ncbi:hypothetical protein KC330_g14 [Hortaea werneckii]|nr:hypothetical protein KC330_g14 [Hortaea werneckii]
MLTKAVARLPTELRLLLICDTRYAALPPSSPPPDPLRLVCFLIALEDPPEQRLLLEINDKYRLFRPGDTVVDLGYAPGSWSQVALNRTQPGGRVVGIDIIPAQPPRGVSTLQGDFLSVEIQEELRRFVVEGQGRPRRIEELVRREGEGGEEGEGWTEEELDREGRGVVELERASSQREGDVRQDMPSEGRRTDKKLSQRQADEAEGRVVNVLDQERPLPRSLNLRLRHPQHKALELRLKKLFDKTYRIKPDSSRKESKEAYLVGLRRKAGASLKIEVVTPFYRFLHSHIGTPRLQTSRGCRARSRFGRAKNEGEYLRYHLNCVFAKGCKLSFGIVVLALISRVTCKTLGHEIKRHVIVTRNAMPATSKAGQQLDCQSAVARRTKLIPQVLIKDKKFFIIISINRDQHPRTAGTLPLVLVPSRLRSAAGHAPAARAGGRLGAHASIDGFGDRHSSLTWALAVLVDRDGLRRWASISRTRWGGLGLGGGVASSGRSSWRWAGSHRLAVGAFGRLDSACGRVLCLLATAALAGSHDDCAGSEAGGDVAAVGLGDGASGYGRVGGVFNSSWAGVRSARHGRGHGVSAVVRERVEAKAACEFRSALGVVRRVAWVRDTTAVVVLLVTLALAACEVGGTLGVVWWVLRVRNRAAAIVLALATSGRRRSSGWRNERERAGCRDTAGAIGVRMLRICVIEMQLAPLGPCKKSQSYRRVARCARSGNAAGAVGVRVLLRCQEVSEDNVT